MLRVLDLGREGPPVYPFSVDQPHPPPEAPLQHKLQPISLPGFSGPLDLLLTLIEEEKVDVSRVSLAAVTAQYLERIQQLKLPPEHLADFLVVAATLLLIKSRALFPELLLTEEEEERVASLEEQLREYRRFRAAAKALITRWEERRTLWTRTGYLGVAPVFTPPPGMGVSALRSALATAIEHLPRLTFLAEDVVRRVVSIQDRIRDLQSRIAARAAFPFAEVQREATSRLDLIVSFLALLELVKQRVVAATQEEQFRDILLTRPAQEYTEPQTGNLGPEA